MLNKKEFRELIGAREFISVATCDLEGRPNAASKFLLKIDNDSIYLVDYTIGRTFRNLSINPRASLSFMDTSTLIGYQINGNVTVIDSGAEFEKILKEMQQKQIDLSIKRIIEGIEKGKAHKSFEVAIPEQILIFKVKVEEVVEMGPGGTLRREKV